jgi:acyl-coenzyme A thioesterase 9
MQKNKQSFQIVTKKPKDSTVTLLLPFATNEKLREVYLNQQGGTRIGRLLEDLDSLAAEVAYKHSDGFNEARPINIVTVAVDRIVLKRNITPDCDLKLEGHVTYVGTTSIEVRVDVTTLVNNNWESVLEANYVMVARDKYENKGVPVHKIEPETEEDKKLFQHGEAKRKTRNHVIEQPNQEEAKHVHEIFLNLEKKRAATENAMHGTHIGEFRTIKSTTFTKPVIMHPQLSAIHNKIMAGYITRQAYELAWVTSFVYAKGRPQFVSLDDNTFIRSIDTGSVVKFTAQVVYTNADKCHVRVETEVMEPSIGRTDLTNVFNFEFKVATQETVVPETYEDAIKYLEGKRIHEKGQ